DRRRLGDADALFVQQLRAAFAIALGQRDRARHVLEQVRSPVPFPHLEAAFVHLRLLLAAIEGEVTEAQMSEVRAARARSGPEDADGWAVVEAHVLAAGGDAEGARKLLDGLSERHGSRIVRGIA